MNEEQLIRQYIHLRDEVLADENKRHKEAQSRIKSLMLRIEQQFLAHYAQGQRTGNTITSVTTASGRATRVPYKKIKLFDPSKFRSFILEDPEERVDLMQNRIHQTNYDLFCDEHPDTQVPGVNETTEYGVTFSKPTKRD